MRAKAFLPAAVSPPRGSFSRAEATRLREDFEVFFALRLPVFLTDFFADFALEDFDLEGVFLLEVFFAATRMLSTRLG
ncbi:MULTISPECIES: hypothetical protein [Bradyrhizobium]|uniref:hypothetical protein n=1 Tax=Bradyrhizobium TaxID=374 RepID=UPI001CD5F382|nr:MULTISPECIES: hypothetical protein [Bradyrhizobium]UWU88674.1 hypothetical protein N2605_22640 [Bradyrhizobium sp. CB1024]